MRKFMVLCLGGLLLSACSAATRPEIECCIDCFMEISAWAWVDENGNGVWGTNEVPLAGVIIYAREAGTPEDSAHWRKTSSLGVAEWSVGYGGCFSGPCRNCGPEPEIEVYPKIPKGYYLTTQPRLTTAADRRPFHFGFAVSPDP